MTETAGPAIRLALQSHRRLVRDALAAYLSGRPEFTVVGQTAGVSDLYPLCLLRRPDVVVVDTGPLTAELVEALRALRVAFPAMEVVVAYTDLTPAATHAAIRAGLTALVPATRGLEALLNMLRRRVYAASRVPPDGLALTDRELEIILLLAAGHSVPEMAALLEISPHTVENHKRHLYAKLGVGTRAHAVSRAAALGLTQPVSDPPVRTATTDGDPLVVLAGVPGAALDEVEQAVAACGLTVIHHRAPESHRGPVVAVLVDPRAADWLLPASMGVPTVVVHSTEPTLAALADAQLRGAHAMLHRDQVPTDLATVLALVRRGYFTMSAERFAELANWMGGRFLGGGFGGFGGFGGGYGGGFAAHPSGLPDLTARERDILASIADGHTVRQTARVLGIAAKTVENTQARLFRKLDARNRAEALTVAYRLGLIDPGPGPRVTAAPAP